MNTDLVVVTPATIGSAEVLSVNARDLHAFLGVGKRFASWIAERIAEYGFVENQDFVNFSQNREKIGRGRPSVDYAVTLDMAKELAMVERTDKGRQVRRYFIECESRLQRVAPAEAAAAAQAARATATLTPDQQATLQVLVHARVEALAPAVRAGATVRCWMALKRHFGCTYKGIPSAQFAAAVSLIARLPLAWEEGGREALPAPRFDATDVRALQVLCGHVRHVREAWHALEPALRALRSPVAAELHDHIVDGVALAGQFERRFRGEFEAAPVGPVARDPETEAWLRQIDAVVPGKRDMGFIRDAAHGHAREARQQPSSLATALVDLLADVRAGQVTGVAAVAFRRDGRYDTVVSHASAWDPLRTLGGVDRLRQDVHRQAEGAGW